MIPIQLRVALALPLLLALACNPEDDGSGHTTALAPMVDEALTDWCADYNPGTGVEQGEDLWRVTLDDPAAVCNDGTPAVMYVRPASSPEFANDWVFYLQGGSTCTDLETCAVRWCG